MDQSAEEVRQREMTQLRLWRFLGIAAAIGGLAMVYSELGQKEEYNTLIRDYIGGPSPQAIFIGALIAVAGVALAVWASRVLKRESGSHPEG